ncbi:hypothetical protein [Microvirga sp. CF3016]|jgi:hypothetical protein|uniref:hypothetical protein n=1 Tax=Microvirga sp. CF3016 TaxID=3110181 RepID=UPI002E76B26B|nr:hypothetical protein [Microvirga sp. CF3016]MEE1613469.1 hypothetical protein [Microvirga sp. CF3016]
MSRKPFEVAQGIVQAIRKAAQSLKGAPVPPERVKLNGRRGYGDNDIPSPDREHDT